MSVILSFSFLFISTVLALVSFHLSSFMFRFISLSCHHISHTLHVIFVPHITVRMSSSGFLKKRLSRWTYTDWTYWSGLILEPFQYVATSHPETLVRRIKAATLVTCANREIRSVTWWREGFVSRVSWSVWAWRGKTLITSGSFLAAAV